jgi:hypothetical protein
MPFLFEYLSLTMTTGDNAATKTEYLLDCSVDYDGSAPVSLYFNPVNKGGVEHAHLRGRALCGRTFMLPDGVAGVVSI